MGTGATLKLIGAFSSRLAVSWLRRHFGPLIKAMTPSVPSILPAISDDRSLDVELEVVSEGAREERNCLES